MYEFDIFCRVMAHPDTISWCVSDFNYLFEYYQLYNLWSPITEPLFWSGSFS